MRTILIFPELILFVTLVGLLLGEISHLKERIRLSMPISVLGLFVSGIYVLSLSTVVVESAFAGSFIVDPFAVLLKLLLTSVAIVSVLATHFSIEISENRKTETHILMVGLTMLSYVLVSATHLFVLFSAIFMFWSVAGVLAGFNKSSTQSSEAALKTLIMGSVGSFFFLAAATLLSSEAGSFFLSEIHEKLNTFSTSSWTVVISFWLFLIWFSIQMNIFPIYYLGPDLTEGAPTPVSGALNMFLRLTAFGIGVRVWMLGFRSSSGELPFSWDTWMQIGAAVTLLVGSFLALGQSSAKRIFGALLLAESGFVVLGFSVLNAPVFGAALFSLLTQVFSILGAFLVLGFLTADIKTDRIDFFGVLLRRQPFFSVIFIFFAAAGAGVPPFPGFLARFALISSVVSSGQILLGGVATLGLGVCWIAAIRMIAPMIQGALVDNAAQNESIPALPPLLAKVTVLILLIVLFLLTFFSDRVIAWSTRAIQPIF